MTADPSPPPGPEDPQPTMAAKAKKPRARKDGLVPSRDKLSMLDDEGHRKFIQPADVHGRFRRAKPWVYGFLIALYAALPFVHVGGNPAVLLDIPGRRFFLFGLTFNAQDFPLAFFILTGIGFGLIVVSALWGRVWCGWACPQTVFLDGVFRRIERLIEGSHTQRVALAKAPWTFDKLWRKGLKHVLYLTLSFAIAHVFLAYFVSMPGLLSMMDESPTQNSTTFLWAFVMTGILYFNFWWFREQLCIVICPYGRLQSALQDDDTVIIGYDARRGEPRGKKSDPNAGDCVDCGRCVEVCPTGIDIRHGLQLECIGCAYCIDACDTVMDKLERPRGLVRYDSLKGLHGDKKRFWRPRVFFYLGMGLLGLAVAAVTMSHNEDYEVVVRHQKSKPFTATETTVTNQVLVHVVNKRGDPVAFTITVEGLEAEGTANVKAIVPMPQFTLEGFEPRQVPVFLEVPRADFRQGQIVRITVDDDTDEPAQSHDVKLVGPTAGTPAPPAAAD